MNLLDENFKYHVKDVFELQIKRTVTGALNNELRYPITYCTTVLSSVHAIPASYQGLSVVVCTETIVHWPTHPFSTIDSARLCQKRWPLRRLQKKGEFL